ncbi:cell division protein FtsQ/DivIB [Heyndrickxia coagulans]|uniref:Cell division protein DivIB n=1 Tax=Heyndrickxia coagulans DSM 1 = ATCC 7050 TaxID=1121088 RepID=A0A8B4BSH3_HEYCO|nr:FtsQ-type POTRA domain-containing protein [Heyndrickxia coagulans]AJH77907.1 cell-division initiation protein [Heyndrickxia coagulans DSM 1 = ATCC 7050]MCR2845324.1 FtsQ-type POTRA domain-containing protein [Heyndrickxia coagulans]MDR4223026.1 FtsQ-type POTRA domain-containing protein [Heyndrickxia coagulans DSM 1 = ATCC 7050]MEC5267592.1 FtsQ-type POTRA domain-containing protein [Heyndrickxia coagulans]MED4405210.1 FtsQ-type POTRA domain-containing protein [Heyndrickxia coagulans]
MARSDKNIVSLEDRIPKLKQQRRRKTNRRLIMLLTVFFMLVMLIIYLESPLSRVHRIQIEGNEAVSKPYILKKSGIATGENIWNIRKGAVRKRIASIPEIDSVKMSISLPNTLYIKVKEHQKIGYLQQKNGFLPVLDNGSVVKRTVKEIPSASLIFTGFKQDTHLHEMIRQMQKLPDSITNAISEVRYTPSNVDRDLVTLYMNNGFEVRASIPSFAEKMAHYPSIISQLDPKKKGVIDLEVGSYFKAYDSK